MLVIESSLMNECIANYMTVACAAHTMSGNHIFEVPDLAEHFAVSEEYIIAQADDIMSAMNMDIIAEHDFYKEKYEKYEAYVFDITMYLGYCGLSEED